MAFHSPTLKAWTIVATVDHHLHHHSPLWGVGVVVETMAIHSQGNRG